MKLIDRFKQDRDKRTLIEALCNQQMVHGDRAVASELANVARLEEFPPGVRVFEQGDPGNDLFFILAGEIAVILNGQEMARRQAGQHVGELALIDPAARRSATIITRETTVFAVLREADFSAIAVRYPSLWRRIAVELGSRLRQRSRYVRQKNETPVLFIGSSRESLPIVDALVKVLQPLPLILRPWTGGVFSASQFPIDDLAAQVFASDFAALVMGPDDLVISRGVESSAPRDNVIFELGLFMGALERARTFLVIPRDRDIKIPTDLLGITPIGYSAEIADLEPSLRNACVELHKNVQKLGAR